jgi:hypothetical protein
MAVGVGSKATFAVTATGTAPLSYQWQVDGTNLVNGSILNGPTISGATTNVLKISNAQTNNSGNYTVIVTNFGGMVASSNAVLTVASSPMITMQPTNQTLAVGSTATLAVTAVGTATLRYHWQVNGTNLVNGGSISGATTANLTIKNAQTNNSGNYTVIVTNFAGSVTSSNAVLTVAVSPVIVMQPTPTNQAMAVGDTATFTVAAVGLAPLSYQWQMNGTNLVDGTDPVNGDITSGSTTNNLIISNAQTTNSGSYTVIVANSVGSVTSSNALLMVTNVPPGITVQPTSQTVAVGSTVTFSVYGTGTSPFFFQWQKDGANLVDGTTISGSTISGSTNYMLTISNAQMNDSGNYLLIITNYGGSVTSSNAVLTVIVPSPSFGNIIAAGGGGFILSGSGGGSNGIYYVLTSSNLLLPLTNWTPIATNQFDSEGNFIFTNTAQTNAPQEFYLLQMQ